ncbi:MAG: hypothetical protein CVU56_09660 [Deltaproteobacteria bacterium HGW-Deltaproteobacteria-14]|jgi:hypothetical protein|nr:MAG: hypothetical protein CVU56_09660 [Deltaproteobacteria bacterium HGW-Deltaproteobacteria-14]
MSVRPAASAVTVALLLAACAGSLDTYPDAVNAWRSGREGAALALAREEYARYRDANDLAEAEVRRVVDGARGALSERPVVPRGGLPAPIAVRNGAPGALRDVVRGDLLSGRITAILRASSVVANLGLRAHAPDLITVVFRRDPVADDGGLLTEASVALRSIAAKRAALDALEAIAGPP